MKRIFPFFAALTLASSAAFGLRAQMMPAETPPQNRAETPIVSRPNYRLNATIDGEMMTFSASGTIAIPVAPGDAVNDAVFFVFANAGGVGGDDARVKNIGVQSVKFAGAPVSFALDGAVLRVKLPAPQTQTFKLDVAWKGVVPRAPQSAGALAEMMGGMDLGGMLGGAAKAKPKNIDYGLYSYGNGVLSLGSFWYPVLAVRENGKWIDEAPEGLGDVAYAEMSDYDVTLTAPSEMKIAATGTQMSRVFHSVPGNPAKMDFWFTSKNVRDFSVVMSDDFVVKSKMFDVEGRKVAVESYTTKAHQKRADEAIEIAGRALQIYAKRFGPYPYSNFKVVEGPIRGGAGGMEYSGMTTIATMLYGDLGKELGALADGLGAPGVDAKALNDILGDEDNEQAGAKENAQDANPAADLLGGMLGQQKAVLDTIFETTIAHEVAHQWWAIGVGSDSQRAPWLDESLTNYSAILYYEDRYGKAAAQKMSDLHLSTSYSMARMLGQKDAPANKRTSAYDGNVQYGAVVYGKGALFYAALRNEIGDAAFFAALRDYFQSHNGKLADAADLRAAFVSQSPQKKARIGALWTRWIEEAHGDEDITGGAPASIADLLGGMLGGAE